MSICRFCGIEIGDPHKYIDKIRELPYTGYHFNAGGAVLIFPFGKVQISTLCDKCDYELLLKEIEEHKDKLCQD
jgi:hypothetical protein